MADMLVQVCLGIRGPYQPTNSKIRKLSQFTFGMPLSENMPFNKLVRSIVRIGTHCAYCRLTPKKSQVRSLA